MNMNVSLPVELANFVKAKVASGRYGSSSEVVREALRLLETRDQEDAHKLEALRQAWAEGVASGSAGPLDLDDVKAEARRRQHRGA